MDTKNLRLFTLVAEKRNIGAAGVDLGMSAATASNRLASLETQLGADLLHRSTRKVSLSVEGEEFLPFAKEIIAQEDAALSALGKQSCTIRGTLRFAAPSTFAQMYIAPLLPKFLQLYPSINIDLRLSDTHFDLIEGSFDLALRNTVLNDSSLRARKLADDTRIVCASPGYLKLRGTPDRPGDLINHTLISFKNQQRQMVSGDGKSALFNPADSNARIIVDDGLTQKLITIAGAGISINSLWSVVSELNNGDLERILPEYTADQDTALWLVYPKSNVLSLKVRVFIDFLVEELGDKLAELKDALRKS